jgi:hypothetical protein
MNEFDNVDIRQWVHEGLVSRATPRRRHFDKKRSGGSATARIAISQMADVSAVTLVTSVSSTQVQNWWSVTAVPPSTSEMNLDLVIGAPQSYWSGMIGAVSAWQDLKEDVSVDVPPLV